LKVWNQHREGVQNGNHQDICGSCCGEKTALSSLSALEVKLSKKRGEDRLYAVMKGGGRKKKF